MRVDIHVGSDALTSRDSGLELRKEIEAALDSSAEDVVLNFGNLRIATQGAIDELIGVLVYRRGEDVLERIVFHNARRGIESLINLAVDSAVRQRKFTPEPPCEP